MLCTFKKLEKNLEKILLENGFIKTSEKESNVGSDFLYRAEEGLYFQIKCDYRDRVVLMFLGHLYALVDDQDCYFVSGLYEDVVNACSHRFSFVRVE